MSANRTPDRASERPRAEPEIIPPGRDAARDADRVWTQYQDSYGMHRIYIVRPGLGSIVLGFFILSMIAALALLVLAGVVLLWLPVLIGLTVLALLFGPLRDRWHRLQDWFAGRR